MTDRGAGESLEVITELPPAGPVVFGALARALKPAPRLSVSAWAEAHRIVSAESGSRYPGPWRNARTPHLVEIMDALGPDDPCEDVVVAGSAQSAKSASSASRRAESASVSASVSTPGCF